MAFPTYPQWIEARKTFQKVCKYADNFERYRNPKWYSAYVKACQKLNRLSMEKFEPMSRVELLFPD